LCIAHFRQRTLSKGKGRNRKGAALAATPLPLSTGETTTEAPVMWLLDDELDRHALGLAPDVIASEVPFTTGMAPVVRYRIQVTQRPTLGRVDPCVPLPEFVRLSLGRLDQDGVLLAGVLALGDGDGCGFHGQ